MNRKELWSKVVGFLDRAGRLLNKHQDAKVIGGAGLGAIVGNAIQKRRHGDKSDGKGAATGAIVGALAAMAHNNKLNSDRLEGGQNYLADAQRLAVNGQFYRHPDSVMEQFRKMVRQKRASAPENEYREKLNDMPTIEELCDIAAGRRKTKAQWDQAREEQKRIADENDSLAVKNDADAARLDSQSRWLMGGGAAGATAGLGLAAYPKASKGPFKSTKPRRAAGAGLALASVYAMYEAYKKRKESEDRTAQAVVNRWNAAVAKRRSGTARQKAERIERGLNMYNQGYDVYGNPIMREGRAATARRTIRDGSGQH